MSASTVSATANPRRRTTSTINDVKQSIDIVNATTSTAVNGGEEVNAVVANNKDLSHSIKGEAIVAERSSKETAPIKKPTSQVAGSGNRTRTRKPTSSTPVKNPKPRWKTVLSVVLKNVLLVAVLVGLIQMVRKLGVKNDDIGGNILGFSDMEGRISSVEKSMRTSAKMLQVQIEVGHKKVESEVANLRREIQVRVDDKGSEIDGKLTELRTKTEILEAGLRSLREMSKGFVTTEDVIRLFDELRSEKGGNELSFDEIRALAREIVEMEIEKHAADGLGMVDYALASGGASVVKHSEPLMTGKGAWFSVSRHGPHENAVRMLSPSFGEPGMCFALKGSSGFVQIRLRTAIVPEAVTLEHVAKSVAYDQSSAPKNCRVFGWLQGPPGLETDTNVENEKVLLAEFTYVLEKSNAQTYNVINSARYAVVDTVRFEFSTNHGSPTHTCIYRLRVHGHEDPNPVPKIA
ncbi:hypothetical protein RND81_04G042900 [Saponaria officinalis]|uniref:SUN domain-containing protein n=1 Tax=Saponaria officinalis TaxID=3572 RepID=A0AAW1LHW1_SAPOF